MSPKGRDGKKISNYIKVGFCMSKISQRESGIIIFLQKKDDLMQYAYKPYTDYSVRVRYTQ